MDVLKSFFGLKRKPGASFDPPHASRKKARPGPVFPGVAESRLPVDSSPYQYTRQLGSPVPFERGPRTTAAPAARQQHSVFKTVGPTNTAQQYKAYVRDLLFGSDPKDRPGVSVTIAFVLPETISPKQYLRDLVELNVDVKEPALFWDDSFIQARDFVVVALISAESGPARCPYRATAVVRPIIMQGLGGAGRTSRKALWTQHQLWQDLAGGGPDANFYRKRPSPQPDSKRASAMLGLGDCWNTQGLLTQEYAERFFDDFVAFTGTLANDETGSVYVYPDYPQRSSTEEGFFGVSTEVQITFRGKPHHVVAFAQEEIALTQAASIVPPFVKITNSLRAGVPVSKKKRESIEQFLDYVARNENSFSQHHLAMLPQTLKQKFGLASEDAPIYHKDGGPTLRFGADGSSDGAELLSVNRVDVTANDSLAGQRLKPGDAPETTKNVEFTFLPPPEWGVFENTRYGMVHTKIPRLAFMFKL